MARYDIGFPNENGSVNPPIKQGCTFTLTITKHEILSAPKVLTEATTISMAIMVPYPMTLPVGTTMPDGAVLAVEQLLLADELLLPGTVLPTGTTVPAGTSFPKDLTDCTVAAQYRPTYDSNTHHDFTTAIVGNAVNGQIRLTLPAATTAVMTAPETGVYDCEITEADGVTISPVLEGKAKVVPEATR